jgi:hypothetical protein
MVRPLALETGILPKKDERFSADREGFVKGTSERAAFPP